MEEKFYIWGEDFPIFARRENKQQITPMHTHHFVEIIFAFDGIGKHLFLTESVDIKKGDIFVIPRGTAHGYDLYNNKTLSIYNLLFIPEKLPMPQLDICQHPGFQELFTPKTNDNNEYQHFSIPDDEIEYLSTLFNEIIKEEEVIRPGNQTYRLAILMQIMCRLARLFSNENNYSNLDKYKEAIQKTLIQLNENFKEDFEIDYLAKAANMSRSNFVKYFKIITGVSPLQYILKLRLNYACRKLLSSDKSITDIAFDAGFSDSNYFSRLFLKNLKCTPRDFRNKSHFRQKVKNNS